LNLHHASGPTRPQFLTAETEPEPSTSAHANVTKPSIDMGGSAISSHLLAPLASMKPVT
jgi:hypothetical protein